MGISIEMFKFYEVGGKIRDELLGLTNKNADVNGHFSVVYQRDLEYEKLMNKSNEIQG